LRIVIREVQENQEELLCSGTQRRLVSAADGRLFSENINAIEEKTERLLDASKKAGLEIHRLIDYMSMSRHQN
jgi:hypothetical protein